MHDTKHAVPLISLRGVSLIYPVLSVAEASLRRDVVRKLVGGKVGRDRSGGVAVQALDNINIKIEEGERVALYGHNGSGKTTLLRVAAGVYHPTRGDVSISGRVSAMLDISMGMSAEATGRQNIRLLGLHRGIPRKDVEAIIPDIEEFSELGHFFDLPIKTYSAGMTTRLAFAFATAIEPDVLILDEWITPGDASFIARATQRMAEHAARARILLLASHAIPIIKQVCTRVIVLEKGRIVDDGDPESVFARLEAA